MKFIYFGSSHFSLIVLKTISEDGFIPELIVTQPDRHKGRGLKVAPTEISRFAEENKMAQIKPLSLKSRDIQEQLRLNKPDFFCVADYGKILPGELLSIPRFFTLGVHPSLLPNYRGAAPINWALINGEKETGITVFKINEHIDAGDIILQKKITIAESDDILSLTDKLAHLGAYLLIEAIQKIERADFKLNPQDACCLSVAPRLDKEDGKIIWQTEAIALKNLIRGTLGWPSAYAFYQEKILKIIQADVMHEESSSEPGTIVKIDKEGMYAATGKGILKITRVKPEGKKEMDAYAFVLGHRVKVGDRFS
jgi:methionyl-tRNA formyltransferase